MNGERTLRQTSAIAALLVIVLLAAGCTASTTTIEQTASTPAPETSASEPTEPAEPSSTTEPAAIAEPTATPETASTAPESTDEPSVTNEPVPGTAVQPDLLEWSPCPGGECTTVTVPLDYDDPTGTEIEVALVRTPAVNSQERIGSLFVNFGGPGGETTSIMAGAGPFLGSIFERFDIVGWDPRGIGQTARLACDALGGDFPTVVIDPTNGFDDEIAEQEAEFARVVDCAAESGPIVDHLGTVNVARDLEQVRIALGDEPLNYLGLSYGTQVGWVYATLFGESVRSMILDGAVPGGAISADDFAAQLAAFERTFDYFDEICDREPTCIQAEEGLAEAVERIAEELDQDPVELLDGSLFGEAEFRQAVLFSLYQRPDSIGALLSTWIDDIDNGDANGLIGLLGTGASNSTPGGYQAVLCADGGAFPGADGQVADFEATLAASETFGILGEIVRCDLWEGDVEQLPAIDSSAAPTIVVIGNTFDAATPFEDAVLLDEQLADSVLLTVDGGGHTATLDDPCAIDIAISYFNDLIAPELDMVCFTSGFFGVGLTEPVTPDGLVTIDTVIPESAAEAAGIEAGDLLVAVDGIPIVVAADIPAVRAGEPSEWTLLRDDEQIGLALRPTPRPWN